MTTSLLALTVGLVASLSRSDNRWPAWLELATRVLLLLSSLLSSDLRDGSKRHKLSPFGAPGGIGVERPGPGEYLRSWPHCSHSRLATTFNAYG